MQLQEITVQIVSSVTTYISQEVISNNMICAAATGKNVCYL